LKISSFFVFSCALICVISCASMRSEENIQKAGAHYKMGVANLNESRIQQAFVEFHKAYELDPNNREVLNAIGILYLLHLDEPIKAIGYFEKAAKADPLFSDAYNNIGYAYEKTGNYEKAITFYEKALSNPVYITAEKAYINIGSSYYRMGKYEAALISYKEALKRSPNMSLAYMRLALCYNALGKYGEASTAMTHAIDLDSIYKGNREKALEDLNIRKLGASGYDERDIRDYLEILKY
jgi:tetratricopeptide (TPR) repeat protein